jgi:hypothetical protein
MRTPFHLWALGLLLVLWNCWGLFGAVAAQGGFFPQMPDEASAYFEQQPLWFVALADLSPVAGVAGAMAVLLQSRSAPRLFLAQIAIAVLATVYELVTGTSPLFGSGPAWGSSALLFGLLFAQYVYARYLLGRGLLD